MIRSRLEYKIFLLLSGVLVLAFGIYLVITIQNETDSLLEQFREKSKAYSETLMTGIRNVMLAGKGSYARSLVNEAREKQTFGSLHIYNRDGKEVFLREGAGVREEEMDPHVAEVLATASPVMDYHIEHMDAITRYEPLYNLSDCQSCHGRDHLIRGVMQVSIDPSYLQGESRRVVAAKLADVVGTALASGFRTIMVAGQGKLIDTLIRQARTVPALENFHVYNRFGRVRFGDSSGVLPHAAIIQAMDRKTPSTIRAGTYRLTRLIPLRNEERCQMCHLEDHEWRGVLAATVNVEKMLQGEDPAKVFSSSFQRSLTAAFRSIMLVGKGGFVRNFIDDIRTNAFVKQLRVFDREGRERFVTEEPRNRAIVTELLQKPRLVEFQEEMEGVDFLVTMTPLLNDQQCQKCHGPNHAVRAIVEVASSMAPINAAIRGNAIRTGVVGVATLLFVALLLHQFMKTVVIKPINVIGEVASKVGEGDLSVRAEIPSRDEIGRLAHQINDMIKGLRERFHLEKFVSRQTVEAVRQSDPQGIKLGGARRVATVFFTDIRGFTAFAEKVEPETVVQMLNECLSEQTRIVKKYGGDIDKFVGDELVAVFVGDDMVDRALCCAQEIQENVCAVDAKGGQRIGIGIGINTGPVVMGAMGSQERMDYTVIGDTVNLGARLCGAAAAGQILVSGKSVALLKDQQLASLKRLEPMRVRGKEKPVQVYEVRGHPAGMN